MIFNAFSDGRFDLAGRWTRCALGKSGTIGASEKREGDGCSPLGAWPLRRLFYRADRIDLQTTGFEAKPIALTDGWCDAPHDPSYNCLVQHPYPASAERLWREDSVYDVIFVLGYNDDPVRPAAGSAIFLHLARPGYAATEGCVALNREDALALISLARPGDGVAIHKA